MSDLAGHHILALDNSPHARQSVADALRSAGVRLTLPDLTGFELAIQLNLCRCHFHPAGDNSAAGSALNSVRIAASN